MSDGITDAMHEDQQRFEAWKERERRKFIGLYTRKELVDELSKREGVIKYENPGFGMIKLHDGTGFLKGPSTLLVIT